MGGATIIDGKAIAAKVRAEVAAKVAERVAQGRPAPGLAVVLVGENPASHVYVRNKARSTREAGMVSIEHKLDASTSEADLLALGYAFEQKTKARKAPTYLPTINDSVPVSETR